MEALVERTVAEFGALHVLVANAGIMNPSHPIVDTPLAEWRQTFAVNVDGVFLSIRYAAPSHHRVRRRLDHHHLLDHSNRGLTPPGGLRGLQGSRRKSHRFCRGRAS